MAVDAVALLLTILVNFIPGLFLSFAFFKNTFFNKWDKVFFSLVFSFTAMPMLSFLEFLLLGVKFSFALVLANALLVVFASIALLYWQKQVFSSLLGFKLDGLDAKKLLYENAVGIILLLLFVSAFYVRFSTAFSPTFFEFDPIYYDKITEKLVVNGAVEPFSPEVYYPKELFTRVQPLSHYLVASWYSSYSAFAGLNTYSKELLMNFSQLYPPLAGVLLAFLAFILLREEYNEYLGLIGAALFVFLPQLIKKFAAGVSEQQPFGLFSVMLIFAVYILAVNRKSTRFSLIAGLAMASIILGSQQFIWPFMVITVYIAFQSALDYLKGSLDLQFLKTNFLVVLGGTLGHVLLYAYGTPAGRYSLDSPNILALLASLAFCAVLYAILHYGKPHDFKARAKWFAGALAVGLIVLFVSPLGSMVFNLISAQTGVAYAQGALGKTIQEEAATNPDYFPSAFGILNPPLVLIIATLLASIIAIASLLKKKHVNYAIVFSVVAAILIFLNGPVDSILTALANATGSKAFIGFVKFFSSSDMFLYLLISLAATTVYYFVSEKKSKTLLLFVLVFFPVAFIGLNKVKYLLHLGIAVALAAVYALGETHRAIEILSDWLNVQGRETVLKYSLVLLILIGVGLVFLEAQTAPESMSELSYNRIPSDWVVISELTPSFTGTPTSAMGWLYHNANKNNPSIQQQCNAKFGWDCRVLSWWDYGHWTTFFGETNSVLDPNNYFYAYDQEVARAFVDGNIDDLLYTMETHRATHILADSDLIGKWGALVFLSGTCDSTLSPTCPATPEIDWKSTSPSSSRYEAEHYYEYLTISSNQCPSFASAVPLPLLESSFGTAYCADNDYLYLLTQTGLDANYKRKFQLLQSTGVEIDHSVSYLTPIAQNRFINLNPDLSPLGLNNTVIDSAFTRLFFFEQLPGFKLVFRAPNGNVKIFEHTGGNAAPAETRTSVLPLPTPSPSPSETPLENASTQNGPQNAS